MSDTPWDPLELLMANRYCFYYHLKLVLQSGDW